MQAARPPAARGPLGATSGHPTRGARTPSILARPDSPPVCVVLSREPGPPRGGGGGDAIRGPAAGSSYPPHEPARAPAPAPRSRPRARPAAGASPASRLPRHPAPSRRRRRRRLSAARSRLGLPLPSGAPARPFAPQLPLSPDPTSGAPSARPHPAGPASPEPFSLLAP